MNLAMIFVVSGAEISSDRAAIYTETLMARQIPVVFSLGILITVIEMSRCLFFFNKCEIRPPSGSETYV